MVGASFRKRIFCGGHAEQPVNLAVVVEKFLEYLVKKNNELIQGNNGDGHNHLAEIFVLRCQFSQEGIPAKFEE